MNKKRLSIQENIIWNTIGSIMYMVTQWLITILVVRIAGVETAGNLTLAISVNNIFYSIAMFGIRNYQVSDVSEKYSNKTYIHSRMVSCLMATILCWGYCMVIGYSSVQKVCTITYCLFKMSEAFYDVYAGIEQREWRMDYIGKSWMYRGIVTFICFLCGLYLTKNLSIAIMGMVISSFLIIILYDIPATKKIANINTVSSIDSCMCLMKECFPLLCYLILSTVVTMLPRLIMERKLGSYALGVYGSVSAPTVIVQMGASYIFNPFMTLFAEQYNNGQQKEFWSTFRKCLLGIVGISIISLAGGKLLGVWGLNLLYGKEIAEYVDLLLPLICSTVLTAFIWFLCGLSTVVRDFKGLIISNVIALIISFYSSFILIDRFTMQGATMALIVSLLIEALFIILFLKKKVEIEKL